MCVAVGRSVAVGGSAVGVSVGGSGVTVRVGVHVAVRLEVGVGLGLKVKVGVTSHATAGTLMRLGSERSSVQGRKRTPRYAQRETTASTNKVRRNGHQPLCKGAPHWGQITRSEETLASQTRQRTVRPSNLKRRTEEPHWGQMVKPTGTSAPHALQRMHIPLGHCRPATEDAYDVEVGNHYRETQKHQHADKVHHTLVLRGKAASAAKLFEQDKGDAPTI